MTLAPSPAFGLIGHEDVLHDAAAIGGHALLLVGPARVGKRAVARTLAAQQNCARPDAPCGECPSCLGVLRGAHPDVLEVEPKTLTSTGKAARRRLIPVSAITEKRDDGREYERHVVSFVEVAPTNRRRVVIVDGAEFLNDEAANALLKVVEEPPHGALFVFLAEEVAAVLPTIASRASRLNVTPLDDARLARTLARLGEDDPALLAFAAGRPGVVVEREAARAALEDARALVDGLRAGMLPGLEAAEGLEKRFDPLWHPEALRFVLRGEPMEARVEADGALEKLLAALEQYVSPSLAFQWFALEMRVALGEG